MREILFRGKTKKGEWCEGLPTRKSPLDKEVNRIQLLNDYLENDFTELFLVIDVIPETVGQYTGLTDKNGKKIFEGDIVSYTEEIETKSKGKETLKGIYKVEFEYCGFSPLDCLACNHLEIIGNIHDNPELLKEE